MTDNITRAWEAMDSLDRYRIGDLLIADLDAIRAVLPPKPEPRHDVREMATGTWAVYRRCNGGRPAFSIPTRDQAERIAAIYNEEVGE